MSARARAPPPKSNIPIVLGLVAFTTLMGSVPILLHRRNKRLHDGGDMLTSDKPLNATQVRRGVYLNTGSQDAGPDPDWDMKSMLYKGKAPVIVDESNSLASQMRRLEGLKESK